AEFTSCPACGGPIKFGISGSQIPPPRRVACCVACKAVIVTTGAVLYRLPTDTRRVRVEARGLAASFREGVLLSLARCQPGVVPSKRSKKVEEFLCEEGSAKRTRTNSSFIKEETIMLDQEALAQLLGAEAASKVHQAAKVRKQVESVQAALREENKRHRQEV